MDGVQRILSDLGALNAHARTSCGAERDAVYAYKEFATWTLLRSGDAKIRPVKWRGECGRCGGDGRFKFWEGGYAPCRSCGATGITELRFAEVTLPDGQKWHHPWSAPPTGFIGYSMLEYALRGDKGDDWSARIDWECSFGWSPRQQGSKLEGDALVEAMNRVEGWMLAPGLIDPSDRWKFECARKRMLLYPLNIRHRIPERCFFCGAESPLEGVRLGASSAWPLSWAASVCVLCYDMRELARASGAKLWWPSELPPETLTPEIELWMSRRPKERPCNPWSDY